MNNTTLVLITYTDSSCNDYNDVYLADNRKVAVELANNCLKAFEKTEGKENIENTWGNLKTGSRKGMCTEKNSITVELFNGSPLAVHNSKVAYGGNGYYAVDINIKED